jgi:3D (Asp-Asp-Asp) domain-containing protein
MGQRDMRKVFGIFLIILGVALMILIVYKRLQIWYNLLKIPQKIIHEYYQEVTTVFKIEGPKEYEVINSDFMTYKGEFYTTSYCPCEICCEVYALNRPVVNGKQIVFTAYGYVAQEGITIATDPDIIPPGTKVYIEGIGVRVAQDVGGAIKGYDIDIYFEDHSNLIDTAVRKVWVINE